jgi:hypothetical protein
MIKLPKQMMNLQNWLTEGELEGPNLVQLTDNSFEEWDT